MRVHFGIGSYIIFWNYGRSQRYKDTWAHEGVTHTTVFASTAGAAYIALIINGVSTLAAMLHPPPCVIHSSEAIVQ